MNILVCVKHVPREDELKLDPVTKTLIRSDGPGEISQMDRYALELGVRIVEELGGSVTAVSMGVPAAANSLRYAVSVGANDVYLLSDRPMGGADAYATALTLAAGVRHLEKEKGQFDLILLGNQASDSSTNLVAPELAEDLGRPHTTNVVDYRMAGNSIIAKRDTTVGFDSLELPLPAVLSVTKTDFAARYPNIRLKLAANKKTVPVLNAADLGLDPADIGAAGSLTSVGSSFVPEHNKETVIVKEPTVEESAAKLADLLSGAGVL